MDLNEAFVVAQSAVAQSSSPASDQQKLLLYAHFKQATCGPARGGRPGMFDFRGRAKWDAWAALGSMDTETAKRGYLSLTDTHAPGWRPTQGEERKPPSQAAHSDCQQSVDEEKDTGVGTSSASTGDTEHVASSQGMHSRSVSDIDDEFAPQKYISWHRHSGLYREGVGGADRNMILSDTQRTADEVGVATTEDAVKGSQGMSSSESGAEGRRAMSWREFSGLYREDVRQSVTVSNMDLPATAPLTWPSDGARYRGSKARADGL